MTREAPFGGRRRAGVLVPLFAIPSARSWGIGELPDIVPLAAWLREAGLDLLQLLPLNEIALGQQSPYTVQSALAIDPIYVSLAALPDFAALGGEAALDARSRAELARLRAGGAVDYAAVRTLKSQALRAAFARFQATEGAADGARAWAFRAFRAAEAWWLEDYAVFRALHAQHGERPWRTWPAAVRDRAPGALAEASHRLAAEVRYRQYLQWIAAEQWADARAGAAGVSILGDLPFAVGEDSADVWARPGWYDLDVTVGAPPDAFSASGQDWGVPAPRWAAIAGDGYAALAERARRMAALYDAYRVDHVVGLFRTYAIPRDGGEPAFVPAGQAAQVTQGEAALSVLAAPGIPVVAEDLGIIPDFVRAALARLGIPGYRVLRWEREWEAPGRPFRDPAAYPACSVATSGTHDTEPLAVWWDEAPPDERAAVCRIPALRGLSPPVATYTPAVRDAFLGALLASGSALVVLPIQDVFGWRERINVPATVTARNWSYRLPSPVDHLATAPVARERAAAIRAWRAGLESRRRRE